MGSEQVLRKLEISNIEKPHCNAIYFQSILIEHNTELEKLLKCNQMHLLSIVDVQNGGTYKKGQSGNSGSIPGRLENIRTNRWRGGSRPKTSLAPDRFTSVKCIAINNHHLTNSHTSQFHKQPASLYRHTFSSLTVLFPSVNTLSKTLWCRSTEVRNHFFSRKHKQNALEDSLIFRLLTDVVNTKRYCGIFPKMQRSIMAKQ